ncbi:MAG: energy-coupling factor transporter transmembrane protein EcfT [Syntrophomonadaceae bacterium]|jgi:biotin transport system permease protein/energy-coupling factor transport system permease protein|nr:energy-coupling factor transporter transmembrane protein EcfT [Syntrophomonadaceae bacterium]
MPEFGQYMDLKSPIHSCDPRVKLLAVLAFSLIILDLNPTGLMLASGVVLAISWLAKIGIGSLFKSSRPVWPLLTMLFFIYVLFSPVNSIPLFSLAPIMISYEGLYLGVFQAGRFLLLILSASLLTMTTSLSDLTIGVEALLRPLRVIGISSHNIALMVGMAIRFIPALRIEMNNIQEAQLARGANLHPGSLKGNISRIIAIATPLTINILRRSDDLVEAMEARGYQAGSRTYLRQLVFSRSDYWALAIISFLFIICWMLGT